MQRWKQKLAFALLLQAAAVASLRHFAAKKPTAGATGRTLRLYDVHHFVSYSIPSIVDHMNIALASITPVKVSVSVPSELGAWDYVADVKSLSSEKPRLLLLTPNTEIKQLYGGYNFGALLWTAIAYYGGPIPSKTSLADKAVPLICHIFGVGVDAGVGVSAQTNDTINLTSVNEINSLYTPSSLLRPPGIPDSVNENQWYLDFIEGYSFQLPPYLDLIRLAMFATLGCLINFYFIEFLGEGDVFWGWSTALATCFPTFLVAVTRDRRVTRELGVIENEIKSNFRKFRETRLIKGVKGKKCSEDAIVMAYQRAYTSNVLEGYRSNFDSNSSYIKTEVFSDTKLTKLSDVRDKTLVRTIRQWYGSRPDRDGNYPELELLSPPRIVVDVPSIHPIISVSDISSVRKEIENDTSIKPTPGNPFG